MSDDKSYHMEENIVRRIKVFLLIYIFLVLTLIWDKQITSLIFNFKFYDGEYYEILTNVLSTIAAIAFYLAVPFQFLCRYLHIHKLIDKYICKVRYNTGLIIVDELTSAGIKLKAKGIEKISSDTSKIFYIFYHFVNKEEETRGLAFTYWENYYTNLNIMIDSLLFYIILLFQVLVRKTFDFLTFAPFIPLLIGFVIALDTYKNITIKIYELPKQQVNEIYATKNIELKELIELYYYNGVI